MQRGIESQRRQRESRNSRVALFLFVIAVFGTIVYSITRRQAGDVGTHSDMTRSRYTNTRPEVKYVGDGACRRCHAEIAETFGKHPMGRSLVPIASAPLGRDDVGKQSLFTATGLEYSIETRDGRVFHQESRRDGSGRLIAQNEAEVQFAVGSARLGIAFLIEHDGYLFQSPITWYARDRKWDLPPGYETSNGHFDRPITSACLFCHANRVEAVPGTVNRYQKPIFNGHSIGCERCHGPGELHVRNPTSIDGAELAIVNPARLEPSNRDAVCEQCHLNGWWRGLRPGRRDEDFRPGLPFYRIWTVLEQPGSPAADRLVGQFEQMRASRCFAASNGQLSCISCHDPHRAPDPDERVAYFRNRCLECHATRGCNLAASERLARSRVDDCTSCHMPRSSGSNTIHVAVTNHRIPRRADEEHPSSIRDELPGAARRMLVNYHRDLMDDRERAEAEREVGVALCRAGPEGAATAVPLLEKTLESNPKDVVAWEAKGFALGLLGQGKEGLEAFKTALTLEPDREAALTGAAYLAAQAGQNQEAAEDWRRAIARSPWRSDYKAELAGLYFTMREWRAAAEACRASLRLNPANVEVRKLLVRSYLRLDNPQAASNEFETLMGFDFPDRDQLRNWFAPLTRP